MRRSPEGGWPGPELGGGGRWGTEMGAGERKEEVGGEGAGGGRVKNWDVLERGRLGEVWGWAGLRPTLLRLKLERARPKDSEVIGSHPTLEVIAMGLDVEVSPFALSFGNTGSRDGQKLLIPKFLLNPLFNPSRYLSFPLFWTEEAMRIEGLFPFF